MIAEFIKPSAITCKKDKALGLYEDGVIEKVDLVERLEKLNDEKKLMLERLSPLGAAAIRAKSYKR